MLFIPPQTLDPLTNQQIEDLISIHQLDQDKLKLPGRVFSHNAQEALLVVLPMINSLLGNNKWKLFEGNFFDTKVGYRVHADTGWSGESCDLGHTHNRRHLHNQALRQHWNTQWDRGGVGGE